MRDIYKSLPEKISKELHETTPLSPEEFLTMLEEKSSFTPLELTLISTIVITKDIIDNQSLELVELKKKQTSPSSSITASESQETPITDKL